MLELPGNGFERETFSSDMKDFTADFHLDAGSDCAKSEPEDLM